MADFIRGHEGFRAILRAGRMNNFDPFGLLERLVPAQRLHRTIRACVALVLIVFLVMRVKQYDDFSFKPLWLVESLLFVILVVAFLVRRDPVDRSRGVAEIIVPLIGSVLPFGLLKTPPNIFISGNDALLVVVFCWMTITTAFTAWGMWILRGSFSITVEARALVTSGPYKWVRHPVYLGEILSAAAVVVWRWSLVNVVLFVLFVAVQLLRSRWEELKLARIFPEYKVLESSTWWFWRHHE
jgi:protein-S-isoprenylcysteine O-methyltransferase Ste14